jgi:protein-tyrosine phosphatase
MSRRYRVVFVCLGNICRSPMAEFAMRRLLEENGLDDRIEVASAGTGDYHVGEAADPRAAATLRDAGYRPDGHTAAQFGAADFADADLVLALDASTAEVLRRRAPDADAAAKVRLLRRFDPAADPAALASGDDLDVPDPYYGGADGFPHVLALVEAACRGLLEHLRTSPAAR